jgi:hypothetical protein
MQCRTRRRRRNDTARQECGVDASSTVALYFSAVRYLACWTRIRTLHFRPLGAGSSPFCFGAKADLRHDDTLALQAASDAAVQWTGQVGSAVTWLNLPPGRYLTSSTIFWHERGDHTGSWWGFQVRGGSKASVIIDYTGPSNTPAVDSQLFFGSVSGFRIVSDRPEGWLSGFEYDTYSSQSQISDVFIDCQNHPGDGIAIGRGGSQADMLLLSSVGVLNCPSGTGIVNLNPNALSITLSSVTSGHNFIGVKIATTTNMTIVGGEYDYNDINFHPQPGTFLNVFGARSEGSRRTLFTTAGTYPQNVNLIGYNLASDNPERPESTATTKESTSDIVLSRPGFVPGDFVVIRGAGANGSDLHTSIANYRSPTEFVLGNPAGRSITGARIALDASVKQTGFREAAEGPYVHIGNFYNVDSGSTFSQAIGPQVFIGNGWTEDIANPFGLLGGLGPGPASLFGNGYHASPAAPMLNTGGPNKPVTFAPNAGAQDVSPGTLFQTANTRDTVISRFMGGTQGEVIYVAVHDGFTSFASDGNIRFSGNGPVKPTANALCESVNFGGYWHMGSCR